MTRKGTVPQPPTIRDATFVAESRDLASLPPAGPPEVAIAGRSNVGKSTLLNRLAGRKALARTSKTPGRTRGIIFYDLAITGGGGEAARNDPSARNDGGAAGPLTLRLADLPGYGFARVSQAERASWQPLLEGYAERRPTLALFIVLIDGRRGIEAEERQLLEWLATLSLPARVVFTKVDKLGASERGALRGSFRDGFSTVEAAGGQALLVSGETGEGVPEVWAAILRALRPATKEFAAGEPSA